MLEFKVKSLTAQLERAETTLSQQVNAAEELAQNRAETERIAAATAAAVQGQAKAESELQAEKEAAAAAITRAEAAEAASIAASARATSLEQDAVRAAANEMEARRISSSLRIRVDQLEISLSDVKEELLAARAANGPTKSHQGQSLKTCICSTTHMSAQIVFAKITPK